MGLRRRKHIYRYHDVRDEEETARRKTNLLSDRLWRSRYSPARLVSRRGICGVGNFGSGILYYCQLIEVGTRRDSGMDPTWGARPACLNEFRLNDLKLKRGNIRWVRIVKWILVEWKLVEWRLVKWSLVKWRFVEWRLVELRLVEYRLVEFKSSEAAGR